MILIRRILFAVIAISVAVLPATAEAIVSPSPAEVTMADQGDMPCCPSCNTQDDFKATACALKCVALAGAVVPAMTIHCRRLSTSPWGRHAARAYKSTANIAGKLWRRAGPRHASTCQSGGRQYGFGIPA